MKKVIVTGASGFIGKHSLKKLVSLGYEVHAICNSEIPDIKMENLVWYKGDLLNPMHIKELFEKVKPTHLLHFAWNVKQNYRDSLENFNWLNSSIDMLLKFKEYGGKRVVYAGTCFQYEFVEGIYDEKLTNRKPLYTYGICKQKLQDIFEKYSETAELSAAWGYIFYPYGPGEGKTKLMSYVINSLLSKETAKCSSGEQIKDFIHVEDVADAFVTLLDSDYNGSVNIASGEGVAVKDMTLKIGEIIGNPESIELGAIKSYSNEPHTMIANTEILNKELGWYPKYKLDSGLKDTINWWKEFNIVETLKNKKFTFVIPVHNGMPYIKQCIESILSQSYKNFNIVVLENASNDGTAEYLESIKNEQIRIFSSDRMLSIEENWARVLTAPRQEFMLVTCADDCYYANYLAEMIKLIGKHPEAGIYRTHIDIINEESRVMWKSHKMPEQMTEADYLKGRLTHTYFETAMGYCFRSKDYDEIGGIDCVHNLLHPDDVLFMKLTRKSYLAISPEYACCYRSHTQSVSASPKSQIALDGYNYFFNYIYNLKNPILISIVQTYLPYHINQIVRFFEPEHVKQLKNMYYLYNIDPNN